MAVDRVVHRSLRLSREPGHLERAARQFESHTAHHSDLAFRLSGVLCGSAWGRRGAGVSRMCREGS